MKRGDIWDVEFPSPIGGSGREQAGIRPAVIVSVQPDLDNPMFMTIPFTSRLTTLRFSHTLQVEPSERNGLTQTSVALVFQLTAVDRRRIIRQRGVLERDLLVKIEQLIKKMLAL